MPKDDQDQSSEQTASWDGRLICCNVIATPIFTSLFIIFNLPKRPSPTTRNIILAASLCTSLLILALIALKRGLTSPSPPLPSLFATLGFGIAVLWISGIATEIVAALESLGVILNISDAILGVTIFAVGNSCNDLVANTMVAARGFPLMAMSASFGGPMLNILLGIGIGGLVCISRSHSPDSGGYHSCKFHVSETLSISGAAMILSLMVIGVWVAAAGWWVTRPLGWFLISLWAVAMISSLAVEISDMKFV